MEIITLRISQIEPDRNQPRKYFDEQSLYELASSISQYGVIEPIIVKPMNNGFYQIIAGERRWRASRIAQLREIPVIIKDNLSELEAFKVSFTENLQRQSLTPIEEALGFVRMIDHFKLTQDEVAKYTGKSRSSVSNTIRLLKLPQSVQGMVSDGRISVAHAKVLLSAEYEYQERLAQLTIDNQLSVKQLESEIKKLKTTIKSDTIKPRDTYLIEAELSLKDTLNRKVKVNGTKDKGTITLEFYGKNDLNDIINLLANLVDKQSLDK